VFKLRRWFIISLLLLVGITPELNTISVIAAPAELPFNMISGVGPGVPATHSKMGYAVDSSNTAAIIGAPSDAEFGIDAGAVYIYRNNNTVPLIWTQEARIVPPDTAPGDRFGATVYISGDEILIGAPGKNNGQGAVYFYQRKFQGQQPIWVLQYIFLAPDGTPGDEFGASFVIINSQPNPWVDHAVIGAPGKGAGAIYLYALDRNVAVPTWSFTIKITAGDGAAGDRFGAAVYANRTADGNFITIGAPNDDDKGTDSGSVYVYYSTIPPGTWTLEQKIVPADGQAGDQFGFALQFIRLLIVGAPGDDDSGADSGSAYIFQRNNVNENWPQTTKLTGEAAGDQFGTDVEMFIDWDAFIGAPGADGSAADTGAAYLYTNNGTSWSFERQFTSPESATGDHYGENIAIGDKYALVGAPLEVGDGTASGAVYSYSENSSWNQNAKITRYTTLIDQRFGSSIAVDGNSAIVGAPATDSSSITTLFAYNGSQWLQQGRFTVDNGGSSSRFGAAVGISGDIALTSAPDNDTLAQNAGTVYVYGRSNSIWTQQTRINSDTPAANQNFGKVLDFESNTALIADNSNHYFYTRNGANWTLENKFAGTASAVVLNGEWAAVGNSAANRTDIYHWNGTDWVLHTPLTASPDQWFGASLDFDGTTLAIGAPRWSDNGLTQIGAVYVYTYDGSTWQLQDQVTKQNAQNYERLGEVVTVENERLMATASNIETVFAFWRNGTDWLPFQTITRTPGGGDFGRVLILTNGILWVGAPLQYNTPIHSGAVYRYQYTVSTDLSVTMTDDPYDPVLSGYDTLLTLNVANRGPEDATTTLRVSLPPGNLKFITGTPGCSSSNGSLVTCDLGVLAANNAVEIEIVARAAGSGFTVTTNATVESNLPEINTTNNTDTETTWIDPSPSPPNPLSPANNTTLTSLFPTFSWSPMSGAWYYEFQIDILNPPNSSWYLTAPYTGGTLPTPLTYETYYWRVRGFNTSRVPSPWSDIVTFKIDSPLDAAPSYYTYDSWWPSLTWNPITDAMNYQVQIAIHPSFEPDYIYDNSESLSGSDLSYTPENGLPNGTWYWRVRARDANGNWSPYSIMEPFTVMMRSYPSSFQQFALPTSFQQSDLAFSAIFAPVQPDIPPGFAGFRRFGDLRYTQGEN